MGRNGAACTIRIFAGYIPALSTPRITATRPSAPRIIVRGASGSGSQSSASRWLVAVLKMKPVGPHVRVMEACASRTMVELFVGPAFSERHLPIPK